MGCFLGCFGFSSKRKRRKPANRVQPGDHKLGSYEPLDSASVNLDIKEEPISTDSESSRKPKEPLNYKIRKKVSFNLNVQTYEPVPKEEEEESPKLYWESDYGEQKEYISQETAKEGPSRSLSVEGSTAAKNASYPSNYRYRNCIDSYDEEDEIAYEESDLDDEDDDDFDEGDDSGGDIDDLRTSQDDFSGKFKSLSLGSQMRDSLTEENLRPLGDLKSTGMNRNARHRSQYVHSVLNPVENLSQWKAVKAKGMAQVKRQRKENVALEPQVMQEIAVDASLSSWIVSADSCQSRTSSTTKSSTERVRSPKKSSFDKTFPWRSRDDMPILDITNLEI